VLKICNIQNIFLEKHLLIINYKYGNHNVWRHDLSHLIVKKYKFKKKRIKTNLDKWDHQQCTKIKHDNGVQISSI